MTTLRSLRSTTIMVNGEQLTLDPEIPRRPARCSPRWDTKGTKRNGTTQVKVAIVASMAATGIDLLVRVNHPRLRVPFAVPGAGGPSRSGRARVATESGRVYMRGR
jgi:hypothetical protein